MFPFLFTLHSFAFNAAECWFPEAWPQRKRIVGCSRWVLGKQTEGLMLPISTRLTYSHWLPPSTHTFRAVWPQLVAANHVFSFDFWQKNTFLTSVNLEGNEIGNEGATAIADMLGVGSQPLVTPHQQFLSYSHLHNVFHTFWAQLQAANPILLLLILI